jgi:hypothetical protein
MCHFLWISEFVYIDNNCIDRYAHRRADTESTRLHRTILLLLLFQYWNFRNAIDDFLCRLIIMIIISSSLYLLGYTCVCLCLLLCYLGVCVFIVVMRFLVTITRGFFISSIMLGNVVLFSSFFGRLLYFQVSRRFPNESFHTHSVQYGK